MPEFVDRDIVSIKDLTREDIDKILATSDRMEPLGKKGSDLLHGRILATLFFEASTRTRLSFEAAMTRLGGTCLGFSESAGTSVEKGENLADTIRTVENYADIIVIRHPLEGSARLAAEFASIPVINAGSGAEEHPTQALLDLYTIRRELGKLDGITVGMVGDLRYGRTVHSLAYALSLFKTELVLVSPELLRMRREVLEDIGHRARVKEVSELHPVLKELDVVYVTRIQKERFPDLDEYEKVKGSYRLTVDEVQSMRKDAIVMHPLPRVDEVAYEVDGTPHAKYFRQVWYGMLVRMGLLSLVLGAVK